VDLRTSLRTHAAGGLRAEHAGGDVAVCGWVAHRRDHGGVIFLDLRDREGLIQVVFHPAEAPEAYAAADRVRPEWVIRVAGQVRRRPEGTVNPNLGTGEVEVAAASLEVLAEAETPPFPIEDRVEADEVTRLSFRYLDLRRPEMSRVVHLRHRAIRIIRRYLDERGFVEVETPMLTRSTPEGARDFLVPARLAPGSFYALPQSPQMFKQILMVAGLDRYYQIARCFRDEPFRADRQPEFTQLDLEMSFVTEEDIFAITEPLLVELVRDIRGVDPPVPFPRLSYAEALDRYGSDKPDLRYGMELVDLRPVVTPELRALNVLADKEAIKAIRIEGGAAFSRRELDQLVEGARGRGAGGLLWMAYQDEQVRSPIERHLSDTDASRIREATGARDGDLVAIVADRPDRVAVALDGLRREMAERLDLVPSDSWQFAWIVDPPLFEWSYEDEALVPSHHPFTAPSTDDLTDLRTARARAYDIVLNGVELGSGSIRIHRPDVQRRVFEVLGISAAEAEEKFGFLLRAFQYGVPPHGGIAPGIDRIVMLLAGKENIREVIAFPKTQSGADPLTGAPGPVDPAQLRELGIQVVGEDRPSGRSPT